MPGWHELGQGLITDNDEKIRTTLCTDKNLTISLYKYRDQEIILKC